LEKRLSSFACSAWYHVFAAPSRWLIVVMLGATREVRPPLLHRAGPRHRHVHVEAAEDVAAARPT
jgi:hypothetical protein